MPLSDRIRQNIRARRQRAGFSQQALANRISASRDSVARWEAGNREPSLDMLDRLAEAFEIDPATLCREPTSDNKEA